MAIDHTKNDYVEIEGLPNVLWEQSKTSTLPLDRAYVIAHHIGLAIRRLAKARPEWTLIADRATVNQSAKTNDATRFTAWCGTEELGTIEREYRSGSYCYGITNQRISSKLERGSYRYTKDANKALKLIFSTFSPKTHVEAMNEATKRISSEISGNTNRQRHALNRITETHIKPQIEAYLLERWDEVMAYAKANGASAKGLEEAKRGPELHETWRGYAEAQAQISNSTGTYVLIRDDRYATYCPAADHRILVVNNLTADQRIKLGMLKLVADNTFLPGIGLRQDATTYFLMAPEPKE